MKLSEHPQVKLSIGDTSIEQKYTYMYGIKDAIIIIMEEVNKGRDAIEVIAELHTSTKELSDEFLNPQTK